MADGKIIIDTLLDPHGLEKGLKSLGGVASAGLKIFTGAALVSGAALTGLGIKAISLASNLEEVQNVVDVTFGDNASKINDWAKSAGTAFGMSELDAKKFNGTMGAMLKSMGLSGDEVMNMSTSMTGLAGDFASFYNLDHQEAFGKIRSGISGETEPLKQLGINMSVANLKAFALTQGINKQYKEMTEAEKATLRYNYILQAGADAQGDFARTSDSLANQMRIAKLNVDSLSADLGKLLLPIAQEAVKSFNDVALKLREAFDNPEVQASIVKIAEGVGFLITKILDLVIEWLPKIIEGLSWLIDNSGTIAALIAGIGVAMMTMNVANMIMGLVGAFQAFKLANEGATVAQWLLNAAMTANPIGLVIALIAGIVAAIVALWVCNEDFRNAVTAAWESIKEVALAVFGWICDFFTETIPEAFDSVKTFFTEDVPAWFSEMWDSVSQFFIDGWNSIVEFFTVSIPAWFDEVQAWFGRLPEMVGYCLGYCLAAVVKFGADCWNWVTVELPLIIEGIVTWFSELPARIGEWLTQCLNDITTWGAGIYEKASQAISDTIDSIVTYFSELPARIGEWLSSTLNDIATWGVNMYQSACQAASDTVDGVIEWFSELPGKMVDVGTNIVEGIWEGITGAGGWLLGKIGEFAGGIVDGIKDFFGIHSPSRLMRDMVGTNIVKGIGVGIDLETPNLAKDINANMSDLTAKLKTTVDYETTRTSNSVLSGVTSQPTRNSNENIGDELTMAIMAAKGMNKPTGTTQQIIVKVGEDTLVNKIITLLNDEQRRQGTTLITT